MKIVFHIAFLVILCNLTSCKEASENKKNVLVGTLPTIGTAVKTATDGDTRTTTTEAQEPVTAYFVSAPSGLNYRASPNGEILGTFPLNTKVIPVLKTDIAIRVKDNGKVINGTWLGVQKQQDTVYVFSGFLSKTYTFENLDIYYASPYYAYEKDIRQGFVNLSERHSWNYDEEGPTLIPEHLLGKDTIAFDDRLKSRFLKSMRISEKDTVFLFNLQTDSVTKFPVKELSVMAAVNIYASGSNTLEAYEYEIGFNLEKKHRSRGHTFAYIGLANPFQTGNVVPMIWKEIPSTDLPKKFDSKIIPDHRKAWLSGAEPKQVYRFSSDSVDFYVQNLEKNRQLGYRYLVMVDRSSGALLGESVQMESEGTYLVPLATKATDREDFGYGQWTGKIFKNKPPMYYGFTSHSFGCQSIRFVDQKEPSIRILCDNRH